MKKALELNDLPKYSPWPARLLGLDEWVHKNKTPEAITREYEYEKWGSLLEKVKKSTKSVTLNKVNDWQFESLQDIVCTTGDDFYILPPSSAYLRRTKLIEDTLAKYLPAPGLIDLGAGYGSVILSLGKKWLSKGVNIFAGEYTASGVELIDILAKAENIGITCGHCDFTSNPITDFFIPEGSIIYTACAMHYVPELKKEFIERLISYNPSAVIHFEPCFEHNDPFTLIGLMRRRYIEINDYNTNLVSLLHQAQCENKIKIIEETINIFGTNPFLPISVIVWSPTSSDF